MLDFINNLIAGFTNLSWRKTFLQDAFKERDAELEDAWNVQGACRYLALWNAAMTNAGWAPWKSGAMIVWVSLLALMVCEVARFGRRKTLEVKD